MWQGKSQSEFLQSESGMHLHRNRTNAKGIAAAEARDCLTELKVTHFSLQEAQALPA